MTAQVDFTTLAGAGRRAGLELLGYGSQRSFLLNLGLEHLERRAPEGHPRRVQAGRAALRELAKPGGLGDFKVMVQGKKVGAPELWGFRRSERAAGLASRMPVPLPAPEHLDLLAGRYPSAEAEFELSWDSLWPDDSA